MQPLWKGHLTPKELRSTGWEVNRDLEVRSGSERKELEGQGGECSKFIICIFYLLQINKNFIQKKLKKDKVTLYSVKTTVLIGLNITYLFIYK